MKKLWTAALLLVLGTSAFAGEKWNNILGFGWRMPTSSTMHAEKQGWDDLKMWQTGLNLSYTGVLMSNGFSVRALADLTFSNSNIETREGSELSHLTGINQDFLIGAGWAPVRTDSLFFGFYGMLGYDFTVVAYDAEAFDSDNDKYRDALAYISFFPALNATFVWTPARHFSLYASAVVGYDCPTVLYRQTEGLSGKEETKSISRGGVKVIPAAGICWRF